MEVWRVSPHTGKAKAADGPSELEFVPGLENKGETASVARRIVNVSIEHACWTRSLRDITTRHLWSSNTNLLVGQKGQQQLEITPFCLRLILNLFLGGCGHYPAGSRSHPEGLVCRPSPPETLLSPEWK